jgi:putative DNA primase/helicase
LRRANYLVTEDSAALQFTARYAGDLRYDHKLGKWLVWTGKLWKIEETKLAFSWARDLVRELAKNEEPKVRIQAGKLGFAAGVEKFAQADRAFAVTQEIWDRDPYLLGTPDGVVDLRTGSLLPPARELFITKATAVAPAQSADCPLWLRFLDESMRGDAGLVAFLKSFSGYMLTGDVSEHALMFGYGEGGNGKTVFCNTLSCVMGDYAVSAAMDAFVAARGEQHPTDMAMLRGARMVSATETEEGRAWAESKLKRLTGGDPVTARFMRQDFFTYLPQFKLLIIGNYNRSSKTSTRRCGGGSTSCRSRTSQRKKIPSSKRSCEMRPLASCGG